MKRRVLFILLPLACVVNACQSDGAKPWRAARLSKVDTAIQKEVTAAVRELLSASTVLLDANTLTGSSHLIVERSPTKDENGTKVYANGLEQPQIFRLEARAGQCRLVQINTGRSRPLSHADCTVLD